ncbi:MAG: DUF3500 domain-containing protein [Planctomycetaceae bacterium]|nr:DUF3500 domain-containing protein [Planctomycetaceae bacterium]
MTECSGSDRNPIQRRSFLKTAATGITAISSVAVASLAGLQVLPLASAGSAASPKTKSCETLVAQFYKTLTDQQKKLMAFDFDHPLRNAVDNNWHITKAVIGDAFTPDQQQMIRDIFVGLHSEEYQDRVMQQVEHDNRNTNRRNGFSGCTVAVFGQPGENGASGDGFEFVLTGRHVTRRVDGNSVQGAAFGGPIFYGHAHESFNEKPNHPGNVYWYQAQRANELFQALDGRQRNLGLRSDPRDEAASETVRLRGKDAQLTGIPVSEFSADQKDLARKVMADVLAPFRSEDVQESMQLIEAGSFDRLHFTWYKNLDVGNDGVWDVWQIEGPNVVWYFRGDPHVHTWVHIRQPA